MIEQGLNAYQNLKSPPVFWPMLLHLCAGAYGAASQPETGLQMLNEAMEVEVGSSKSADTFTSEFLILKGALLLALSSDNAAEAEALYEQAVLNAQEVRAPMLELRAAIGLSRLWHEQGDNERARKVLSEAYSKITEGFATPDLKEASALLADLSERTVKIDIEVVVTEDSSLRVSVATLNRVILVHPKDENIMLALERKATVSQ